MTTTSTTTTLRVFERAFSESLGVVFAGSQRGRGRWGRGRGRVRERSILSFQRAQLAGRDARALEGVWRLPGFLVSFPIGTDFENHRRSSTFENRLWWIGNEHERSERRYFGQTSPDVAFFSRKVSETDWKVPNSTETSIDWFVSFDAEVVFGVKNFFGFGCY